MAAANAAVEPLPEKRRKAAKKRENTQGVSRATAQHRSAGCGARAFRACDVDDGQLPVRVAERGEQSMHALEGERGGGARGAGAGGHAALLMVNQRRQKRVCPGQKGPASGVRHKAGEEGASGRVGERKSERRERLAKRSLEHYIINAPALKARREQRELTVLSTRASRPLPASERSRERA